MWSFIQNGYQISFLSKRAGSMQALILAYFSLCAYSHINARRLYKNHNTVDVVSVMLLNIIAADLTGFWFHAFRTTKKEPKIIVECG